MAGAGDELADIAIPFEEMLHPFEPVAGAEQGEVKGGAPGGPRRQGLRGHGPDLPACFRSAGHGSGSNPEHENRHSGCLRSPCEATAGREIIGLRLAPDFHHHRRQRGAAGSVQRRLESCDRITWPHQDDRGWGQSEFGEPRWAGEAGFMTEDILTHPEQGALPHILRADAQPKHR